MSTDRKKLAQNLVHQFVYDVLLTSIIPGNLGDMRKVSAQEISDFDGDIKVSDLYVSRDYIARVCQYLVTAHEQTSKVPANLLALDPSPMYPSSSSVEGENPLCREGVLLTSAEKGVLEEIFHTGTDGYATTSRAPNLVHIRTLIKKGLVEGEQHANRLFCTQKGRDWIRADMLAP